MTYFIDMLDPNDIENADVKVAIDKLTITNIGRRPKAMKDNNVNCMFNPQFPNFLYV
jgi:hypothetical protein